MHSNTLEQTATHCNTLVSSVTDILVSEKILRFEGRVYHVPISPCDNVYMKVALKFEGTSLH